ncbi:MAG: hypothetical protein GXP31_15675 [Kiritimatiellaeota bacterium]|nr:hypothetical protein [Kiritimatiellota bacterium]
MRRSGDDDRSVSDARPDRTRRGIVAGLIAAAVLPAPAAQPREDAGMRQIGERVWECRLPDAPEEADARYTLFLPNAPGKTRRPVVVLLHGAGRNSRTLFDDAQTRKILSAAPFATLMPEGRMGWWADSPISASSRYETLVARTLSDAEQRFPVGGKPALRGLAGWSMGGFGCMRYAERHRQQFRGVASMIGLLDWPNPDLPERWNHAVPPVLGAQPRQFNPILGAERLRGMRILLVTGDRAFDLRMNRNFHRRLDALRIPHTYRVLPGQGHTFACVRKALPQVVAFFRDCFADAH